MFMMSEGGHKENIAELLAITHQETEAFSRMALHVMHVAYNLVRRWSARCSSSRLSGASNV